MKKLLGVVTASMLALGLGIGAASAATSSTVHGSLRFRSAKGDYIGQGTRQYYTVGTRRGVATTMTVKTLYANDQSIEATVVQGAYDHWWYLDLAAADGQPLAVGHYVNAMREPFKDAGHPGLSFDGDGRGCNNLFGEFTVHKLARATDGHVTLLDVDFVQHCERADAPALRGHLHYDES